MKRIQRFAAVTALAAILGPGIPAMAQDGYAAPERGRMQYQSANQQGNREWNDNRNREFRNDNRAARDRRNYDRRDYDSRRYRDDRGDYYGYAPVYQPAPVYGGPVFEDGYYYRTHNGRTAAIVGGSAAAGAVIGAAVGHGQGAVIGAVIGGIAGAAASAAANHHDRY